MELTWGCLGCDNVYVGVALVDAHAYEGHWSIKTLGGALDLYMKSALVWEPSLMMTSPKRSTCLLLGVVLHLCGSIYL